MNLLSSASSLAIKLSLIPLAYRAASGIHYLIDYHPLLFSIFQCTIGVCAVGLGLWGLRSVYDLFIDKKISKLNAISESLCWFFLLIAAPAVILSTLQEKKFSLVLQYTIGGFFALAVIASLTQKIVSLPFASYYQSVDHIPKFFFGTPQRIFNTAHLALYLTLVIALKNTGSPYEMLAILPIVSAVIGNLAFSGKPIVSDRAHKLISKTRSLFGYQKQAELEVEASGSLRAQFAN